MSVEIQYPPNVVRGTPTVHDILNHMPRKDVEDDLMVVWDKGVFLNELTRQGIVFGIGEGGTVSGDLTATAGLQKGTFRGTQMALTEIYSLLEEAYNTLYTSDSKIH